MEITQILKTYADNKIAITRMEAENKLIQPEIMKFMEENKLDKQPTSVGDFVTYPRKVWTYSQEVLDLESQLDETKVKEEQTGVATFVEKATLKFNAKKDE